MNLFDKQIYHYITLILLVSGVYALADDAAMYTFGFLIIWWWPGWRVPERITISLLANN